VAWINLGTIAPDYGLWTPWPVADVGGDLFRLTHSYQFGGVPGRLLVAPLYPAYNAHGAVKLVYPDPLVQLHYWPVPPEFAAAGAVVREIETVITVGSKAGPIDNWTVQLEVWDGPTAPTAPSADGGIY